MLTSSLASGEMGSAEAVEVVDVEVVVVVWVVVLVFGRGMGSELGS